MVPRSDGRAYDVEPIVSADNCLSCGICAGSCPTSTPFRRAKPIEPGIQLPQQTIAGLRDDLLAASERFTDGARIVVFGCKQSGSDAIHEANVEVISMPCTGMLPPSFIDFALSRDLADGVMVAGCAEGDCHYRLGNDWTLHRVAGQRDPYLRQRVPLERLRLSWLPVNAHKRRLDALRRFKIDLQGPSNV
jgi:coenzyme F420-reducing hydrogenase delta subunit